MLAAVESAITSGNAPALQQALFDLFDLRGADGMLDDEIAFGVIALLRRQEMKASPLAAHLLNFLEFQASHLSQRAKDRCVAFLREWGDSFSDLYGQHVVAELRSGPYLKPEAPKEPRKKPRHDRHGT
jgi:hypothetical protein